MRVYPWRQRDNQGDRKLIMRIATSSAVVFRIVGGILSLGVASLTGLLLVRRFAKRNDSWVKRGAYMTLIGLAIFLLTGGPSAWAGALSLALMSFGDKVDATPTLPLIGFILRSIAFGFVFQGIAVIMASYVYEVTGNRYLERVLPTRAMKKRARKNEVALIANDKPHEESIAFGLIVDDPIPWRTGRYGMICARPLEELGHGVIVGGNGTGKTVTALSIAYQASMLDAAVFYIDFKASLRTLETVKKAATKAGKKFYSFDLGTGSVESSWYDPLDWKGTSSEKASMIVNSLQFTEDGSAAYYRGVANDWLILQFDVIAEVGLHPGESSFDFLLETSNTAKMKERLSALRKGDARQKALYPTLLERADMVKTQDLAALRQNLSIVVNAGGERLRPQTDSPAILMSRAVEEGAVIYFGLSPSTDQVALKTIGSLILRNLGVLAGERMRQANLGNLRPIVTLVDEASRLQDRAVVMDNLLATAREGEIFLWMITQSFATWPKSTVVEMNTNVQTHVAFRVQDVETAEHLVSTLPDVPVLEEMEESRVRHRAFQGDVKERSGDARLTLTTGPFLSDAPMEITSVENLHAYIWFTGSWTRATMEDWSSKRLKRPDSIRADAPLVRVVFMDYEAEEEPIQGTSFAEMVTSADEIAYNMEHTTLKRTRKESLVEEEYDHIHLPGARDGGAQWSDDQGGDMGGYGPDQGVGYGMGGSQVQGAPDQPMWADDGPQWDAPAPTNGTGAPTPQHAQADDISWADDGAGPDDDAPPVAQFYKGGSKVNSARPASSAPAPASAPQGPSFADPPQGDSHRAAPPVDQTASAPQGGALDDGLLWDDGPAGVKDSGPQWAEASAPSGQEFAPDSAEPVTASASTSSAEPSEDQGSFVGAEGVGGDVGVPPVTASAGEEKGGDSSGGGAYTDAPLTGDVASPVAGEPVGSLGTEGPAPSDDAPVSQSEGAPSRQPSSSAPVVGAEGEGASEGAADAGSDSGEGRDSDGSAGTGRSAGHGAASGRKSGQSSRGDAKAKGKKNASDDWL